MESSPIDDIEALVITTDDGTTLYVAPVYFGGTSVPYRDADRLRWHVWTSDRQSFVGPAIGEDRSPEAVQRAISAWWRERPQPPAED